MIPKERCSQNTIYFLISGSVRVTSDEHPDTVFHDGQFIMQPIGSRVEFHILESTECILYLFETPQNICTDRFNKGLELAKESPMLPIVMDNSSRGTYIEKPETVYASLPVWFLLTMDDGTVHAVGSVVGHYLIIDGDTFMRTSRIRRNGKTMC